MAGFFFLISPLLCHKILKNIKSFKMSIYKCLLGGFICGEDWNIYWLVNCKWPGSWLSDWTNPIFGDRPGYYIWFYLAAIYSILRKDSRCNTGIGNYISIVYDCVWQCMIYHPLLTMGYNVLTHCIYVWSSKLDIEIEYINLKSSNLHIVVVF